MGVGSSWHWGWETLLKGWASGTGTWTMSTPRVGRVCPPHTGRRTPPPPSLRPPGPRGETATLDLGTGLARGGASGWGRVSAAPPGPHTRSCSRNGGFKLFFCCWRYACGLNYLYAALISPKCCIGIRQIPDPRALDGRPGRRGGGEGTGPELREPGSRFRRPLNRLGGMAGGIPTRGRLKPFRRWWASAGSGSWVWARGRSHLGFILQRSGPRGPRQGGACWRCFHPGGRKGGREPRRRSSLSGLKREVPRLS